MFCTVYRWLISRSMDSPGPLSHRAAKHVDRCPACRDYRDRCVELAGRLAGEAREQADPVSGELHARILLRCGAGAEAAAPGTMPRLNSRRIRVGLVAAAVAAAIVVALAAYLLHGSLSPKPQDIAPKPAPSPHRAPAPDEGVPIDSRWLAIASAEVNNALGRSMDSGFERLRQSGLAAADFVLARMPVDIDLP